MNEINSSPKKTFLNLTAEKRSRIECAAIREFAEYGFTQASVNRIVKDIGIAKGSLYQYFNGKEGLFLHIFNNFTKQVKESVKESQTSGSGELLDQIRLVIDAGFDFIKLYPDYFRLYIRLIREEDIPYRKELISKVRLFPVEFFNPLIRAGQERGLVRKDVSSPLIVLMIDTLLERLFISYAEAKTSGDLFNNDQHNPAEVVDQIMCLLESGISGTSG